MRFQGAKNVVRVAALGDIHFKLDSKGHFRELFERVLQEADVLLLCGDITHFGLTEEALLFIEEAARVLREIPVLGVLGNHDFESGNEAAIHRMLSESGIAMFDGNSQKIYGIGFTGVKGFGGGFGARALQPWGESAIKNFVQEVAAETQRLASGLSKLEPGPKIVMMHYSPIVGTISGEPAEVFPFLGSSALEEPLNRFQATAVFHGHAHSGSFAGKTGANIPVYNVSIDVLKHHFPDRLPFFVLQVPVES
ncbi:MAG: metallophosphoesterase [Syntrophobacteraceae bacterium]|nr:metallophosphoesterase [Syntrophobacteraceae bacterium]